MSSDMPGRLLQNPARPIDIHVGGRLHLRRVAAGWTVERFAVQLGVTAPMLRSIESGERRLDPPRLCLAAQLLGVPVSFFYADGDDESGAAGLHRFRAGPFANGRTGSPDVM
jgi:transcriptional regulator with XRE-family HTH domain